VPPKEQDNPISFPCDKVKGTGNHWEEMGLWAETYCSANLADVRKLSRSSFFVHHISLVTSSNKGRAFLILANYNSR
jgi:hypothetical protein